MLTLNDCLQLTTVLLTAYTVSILDQTSDIVYPITFYKWFQFLTNIKEKKGDLQINTRFGYWGTQTECCYSIFRKC